MSRAKDLRELPLSIDVTPSGAVGIGTSSPSQKLHIEDTTSANTSTYIQVVSGNTGNAGIAFGDSDADLRGGVLYNNNDNALRFFKSGFSEAMRIDNLGTLAVGTTHTNNWATFDGRVRVGARGVLATTTASTQIGHNWYYDGGGSSGYKYIDTDYASRMIQANGYVSWELAGSGSQDAEITFDEKMRLDASGNLLVGNTSTGLSSAGVNLHANGTLEVRRDLGSANTSTVVYMSRASSDGNIIQFYKDTTHMGSIGVGQSSDLYIGTSDTGILTSSSESITPWNPSTNVGRDAAIDLGTSDHRFKDLYLSGGVYLGGTGSANKLDDYETGEFDVTATPITSGTVTLQSANNRASYTKVGRLVHCSGFFIVDSVSSPVGTQLTMTLPFAAGQGGDQSLRVGMPIVHYDGSSDTVKPALVIETQSIVKIIMDCSTISAGDAFYYGFTYQTS